MAKTGTLPYTDLLVGIDIGRVRLERKLGSMSMAEIGATFYLVEVIKSHVPRLYGYRTNEVGQPSKGSTFFLNKHEAIVVSSLPPSRNSTQRPLLIRCFDDGLTIENAVHSVLALTQLHYGSVRMPRLPVTLHYSDQIAYLLLRGVRPSRYEGTTLWWL